MALDDFMNGADDFSNQARNLGLRDHQVSATERAAPIRSIWTKHAEQALGDRFVGGHAVRSKRIVTQARTAFKSKFAIPLDSTARSIAGTVVDPLPALPYDEKALMADAALPFRPRTSHPVDRALATIEGQATAVRRRVNRFVFGHALFVTGGAGLLGACALVLLAFVLSRADYAMTTWLIVMLFAFLAAITVRAARGRWLPRVDAAVRIDHQAGLEDRLATLSAAPSSARTSRLWEFLLHENLRLLSRWEPQRFQPRATPRSAWFFACCLVVTLVVLSRVPKRDGGEVSSADLAAGPEAAAEIDGEQPRAGNGPQETAGSSIWSDLPETLRQAILGGQASRNFEGVVPDKTVPVDRDPGGPAIAGKGLPNKGPVRSAPATADAARFAGQGTTPPAAQPVNPAKPPTGSGAPSSQIARGDAPKALERIESGRGRPPAQTHAGQGKGNSPGTGGAGAGSGGDKAGLYGERQAPGHASGSFTLDLDAAKSSESTKEGEGAPLPLPPSARLAEDQRLDDAVRRAQVPVEYETIVQRMFNRGEGAESSDAHR
jgi:hypothetical protein